MTLQVDEYRVALRFPRLFPDPALFEDPTHVASRILTENGLPKEKSDLVLQITDDILPVDDHGLPSVTSGTSKFLFEGKLILAEYMSNANLSLDYVDFGTGMSEHDQSRLWSKGRVGELRFELREFKHQTRTLNIPDVSELYKLMKDRATPSTLSAVELEAVPAQLFRPVLAYVDGRLRVAAMRDGMEIEVYAAKDLSSSERATLEKRLTRPSGKSTIFVILSRDTVNPLQKNS